MSAAELPDPGRRWRRCVRVGAVLCTLATVVPFEGTDLNQSILGFVSEILRTFSRGDMLGIKIFANQILTCILSGPVFMFCASKHYNGPGVRGKLIRVALGLLWLISSLYTYYGVIRLYEYTPLEEFQILLMIGGLSVFLLVTALPFLASRLVWQTKLYPFGMGMVPIALAAIAWPALVFAFAYEIRKYTTLMFVQCVIVFGVGTCGSVLMLLGWLLWWRAVRAAMRAKPEAVPVAAALSPDS